MHGPAKPVVTPYRIHRATLALIERSLLVAKKQGTPAQSITLHPDGRVAISLQGDVDTPEVNGWDAI